MDLLAHLLVDFKTLDACTTQDGSDSDCVDWLPTNLNVATACSDFINNIDSKVRRHNPPYLIQLNPNGPWKHIRFVLVSTPRGHLAQISSAQPASTPGTVTTPATGVPWRLRLLP